MSCHRSKRWYSADRLLRDRPMIVFSNGLEHLHALNIFHNDIKPENILIGEQGQAKLADYGIVGVSADGNPVTPLSCYVLHIAPETVAGRGIECRTDVFQLGLTLFRLLVGLGTLKAKHDALGRTDYIKAGAEGALVNAKDFPAYVPVSVRRIILKATSVNPDERFQSALEMRRAFEKLNFAGYWIVDAHGRLVGHTDTYEYRYELERHSSKLSSFRAYKKFKASGRETAITASSSGKPLPHAEAIKLQNSFIKAVVEGF